MNDNLNTRHQHTTWHQAVTVPLTYFRVRPPAVHLDVPVPQPVLDTATQAMRTHHDHHCRPCRLLSALDTAFGARWKRLLTLLGALAFGATASATTLTTPPAWHTVAFAIAGAAAVIEAIALAGAAATLAHRRHMPMEMFIRIRQAHATLTRPGAQAR